MSNRIIISFSKEAYDKIHSIAESKGLSASGLIRMYIMERWAGENPHE